MKQIKSKLGQCGMKISATPKKDKADALAEQALLHVLYHKVPAKAFAEDTGFTRESVYSTAMAENLVKFAKEQLSEYFENIEIETFNSPKLDDYAKYVKVMKSQEMPDDIIAAGWAKHPKNPANKPAAKTEPKSETSTTEDEVE